MIGDVQIGTVRKKFRELVPGDLALYTYNPKTMLRLRVKASQQLVSRDESVVKFEDSWIVSVHVETPPPYPWGDDRERLFLGNKDEQINVEESEPLQMVYRNHRGQTMKRLVIPISAHYGSSPHHPLAGKAWYLLVFDLDKLEYRDFLMVDIVSIGSQPKGDSSGRGFIFGEDE